MSGVGVTRKEKKRWLDNRQKVTLGAGLFQSGASRLLFPHFTAEQADQLVHERMFAPAIAQRSSTAAVPVVLGVFVPATDNSEPPVTWFSFFSRFGFITRDGYIRRIRVAGCSA